MTTWATRPADALAALEGELREEKSTALGRIGHLLEGQLAELAKLAAALPFLDGEERAAELAAYGKLRDQAIEHRWYLEVQREAIGVRSHEALVRLYPIPPRLE